MLVEYLRNPKFLIGLLLILGGFDIGMWWTKLPRLLGIIMMLIGIILVLAVWKAPKSKASGRKGAIAKYEGVRSTAPRLSHRLIQKLTINGRLLPYLWLIGLAIIAADLALNAFVQKSEIGGNDLIVIFFGITLIAYEPPGWMTWRSYAASMIRKKWPLEMDFLVIFFGLLILILVIPLYAEAVLTGHTQGTGGAYLENDIVYVLLTAPLSGILSVLGIVNSATGAILTFEMADSTIGQVGIAATCAGIYSFGIFLSAFIAFVLSEYSRFTRRIGILLVVGAIMTYLANLLRMTLIVLAGYYNGIGTLENPAPFTLLWTHQYAGELIFISWVAVFWWIAFRYLASEPEMELKKEPPVESDEEIRPAEIEPAGDDIWKEEHEEDDAWKQKVFELRKGKTA